MRTVTNLAAGDGFSLERVRIRAESETWSPPEVATAYRVVLVRSGAFRARVDDQVLLADPALAYLGGVGQELSIAHRPGIEDICTTVTCSPGLMRELAGDEPPCAAALPVNGRLALAHRLLVSRAGKGANFPELAEMVIGLMGDLFEARNRAHPVRARGRATTLARRRALVESVRTLIADDLSASLRDLARRVGWSPYHLSRAFRQETGVTLTAYRNRIRTMRALEAIEAGHDDLASLAADLGFADHAHLTRTIRGECGLTPVAVRRMLAVPPR
ncbi:AraC family transcriptional regulator [Nonomuraea angiospora]|uniref:helix-turn-helix domain-containing protein n=1 Tax=Nonomuraea angiospora TaxID=46172 RepID=UPI00331EA3BE